MKIKPFALSFGLASLLLCGQAAGEAVTDPVGFITLNITPSPNGTTRALTLLSAPLLSNATKADQVTPIDGASVGALTSFSSNTLVNAAAAWTAGELSQAATPKVLKILSGAAEGRTFLLSSTVANTATTVTLDATETTNLTTIGLAAGDRYQIYDCDTLASFFGDPAPITKNNDPNSADQVMLLVNGTWNTYFYHVTNNRWTRRTFGNPDASNQAIKPEAGIIFNRIGTASMALNITGSVPMTKRADVVRASGLSFLGSHWPVDTTLVNSGIQNITGWVSNTNVNSADQIQILISGTWNTFWFDGTNWKRRTFGSPVSDNQVINAGSAIIINKLNALGSSTLLTKNRPF
jgi:hypothetical protein